MTHNDPEWLTMTQDDIPGVLGAPGGPGGRQGAPGGARGVQATPGAKKSVKQQNSDPKPWFKVPKVCPDPKGVVFTNFWGICGHLDALEQRYLVKLPISQKPGLRNNFMLQFFRPPWCKFSQFSTPGGTPSRCGKLLKNLILVIFGWKNGRRFTYFFSEFQFHF